MTKKKTKPKKFIVTVTQDASAYYIGNFEIEVSSLKEAKSLVDSMTKEELDEKVQNWEQSDYIEGIIETTEVVSIEKE